MFSCRRSVVYCNDESKKHPHELLLRWTEYTFTENFKTNILVKFLNWPDFEATVHDKLSQKSTTNTFNQEKNSIHPPVIQQAVHKQSNLTHLKKELSVI